MRVDELVDGILVGIGDRDAGLAIIDAHVTDGVHTAEVGDERTVDALELLAGQTALQSLEVGEGRDLTALCEIETHIVVHALDVENIVEVDADNLFSTLATKQRSRSIGSCNWYSSKVALTRLYDS